MDTWIAATAVTRDLPVYTQDEDFSAIPKFTSAASDRKLAGTTISILAATTARLALFVDVDHARPETLAGSAALEVSRAGKELGGFPVSCAL
jgi:hypothetical protein